MPGHPKLEGLRRISLLARNAAPLHAQLGFRPVLDHSSTWSTAIRGPVQRRRLPNKRLKRKGDERVKGTDLGCPRRVKENVQQSWAVGGVARKVRAVL